MSVKSYLLCDMQLDQPQSDDFLIQLSNYMTCVNGGKELPSLDQYMYVPSVLHQNLFLSFCSLYMG